MVWLDDLLSIWCMGLFLTGATAFSPQPPALRPFSSQPSHRALVLPWALDPRVDAAASKSHFQAITGGLVSLWQGILQDEPARPIRDSPDGVGPNTALLADGVSMGFAIPSLAPVFTPAPAPAPAPTPTLAPAPVTAGGTVWRKGKWIRHAWQRNWMICEVYCNVNFTHPLQQ